MRYTRYLMLLIVPLIAISSIVAYAYNNGCSKAVENEYGTLIVYAAISDNGAVGKATYIVQMGLPPMLSIKSLNEMQINQFYYGVACIKLSAYSEDSYVSHPLKCRVVPLATIVSQGDEISMDEPYMAIATGYGGVLIDRELILTWTTVTVLPDECR